MANVLIIDDDEVMCGMLAALVRGMGHEALHTVTAQDGCGMASRRAFDVIFLDVNLPDGSGLDLLPRFQALPSSPEIIIITGQGDPDGAEIAIRKGAWDYIEKPSSIKQMALPLVRALQYREEKRKTKPSAALKLDRIVGSSSRMKACYEHLARAAGSAANVLVTGETGTGKELFAWAIHQNSPRAPHNFVVVDCAALPDTLVESILFGHEKGSFTGADRYREGLIKQADGGTLFLDEIGELPLPIQKAFLRVLQERRFRPLGGRSEVESDFRLIAATNRDLDQMVEQDQFREDLLFRLRSMTIELPPLREHREDIPEIALYYTAKLCSNYGIGPKGFSPEFLEVLSFYPWPGNVRELIHALERTIAAALDEPTFFPKHLPDSIRIQFTQNVINHNSLKDDSSEEVLSPLPILGKWKEFREEAISRLEKQYVERLMNQAQGKISAAGRIAGLSRARLYALLSKHHVSA
jgi:two-component system, NtrC family, response regulator